MDRSGCSICPSRCGSRNGRTTLSSCASLADAPPVTVASIVPIRARPRLLQPEARLLGLDVGTKTIGMALSDVTRSIATPFDTIHRTKFTVDAKTIREVVEKNQVGALVIGFPLNLDGS